MGPENVEIKAADQASLEKYAFKKGDVVVWAPQYSRKGFYGAPGAREPWLVEIIYGPTPNGRYEVRVMDSKFRLSKCTVYASALKPREDFGK